MSFYLKYRPQTISDLDLSSVREALASILSSSDLPHAYLFSGPKGLGKTSAARIVAKAVNCETKRKDFEPCNKCESCRSITNGNFLDVVEIDAASNRGIDDIRALRETIKLAPARGKYKVYIIDEVHMLTPDAFNAILKTLEEPPEHAVFILATTEPEKLPGTVISRCIRIKFKTADIHEIASSLAKIAKAEGLKIDKESLELLASFADGSFRDGVKLLEQLSYSGKVISSDQVKNLVLNNSSFKVDDWLELLFSRKTKDCLILLDKAVKDGVDPKWLTTVTLESLRRILLTKYKAAIFEGKTNDFAENVPADDIYKLVDIFLRASAILKNAVIPQLPLELAVIEWSGNEAPASDRPPVIEKPKPGKEIKTSLKDVQDNWEKILRSMRPHNNSIEALLRSTRPVKLEAGVLTIEVFYRFHKDKLEAGKCPVIIKEVLQQIFGEDIKLKCILGEKTKPAVNVSAHDAEEIFLKN